MNERDPQSLGRGHAGYFHAKPMDEDLPIVWEKNPTEDLHQGRLSSAVFSNQGQNLAPPQLERNIAQGDDAREPLGDSAHREEMRLRVEHPSNATFSTPRDSF